MFEAGSPPAAGFVLAGGGSTRMGTDKALLLLGRQTLLEHMATQVLEAAGNVTILADPLRYARFGFPVLGDRHPGRGPLGGVVTALESSGRPWNLIVACDMPNVDVALLRRLLDAAAARPSGCDCVAPLGPSGPEPLCAVYHREALPKVSDAFNRNILKMMTVLELIETCFLPVPEAGKFRNINTPADWATHD